VFPGTPATAEVLIEVLATLSRDDTLFHCAHANTIVSGHASLAAKERQQILLTTLCTHEEIDRINTFGVWRAHRLFSAAPAIDFTDHSADPIATGQLVRAIISFLAASARASRYSAKSARWTPLALF